jgi:hypothetical protein
MNAPTEFELMLGSALLIFLTILYALVKYLWRQPLRNGPGYFLGIEVPAGFYGGPGKTWLKSYRTLLVVVHLVLAVFFGVCVAIRRWDLIPLCGFWAIFYLVAMQLFQLWTRHKLGANPPVRAIAFTLESRRLSDYISWPFEALWAGFIAVSWWLLLRNNGMPIDWLPMLQLTWTALVLPAKILLVRASVPLPAERAEEHYRYQDALRRIGINQLTAWSWGCVVLLFGIALGRTCSPALLPIVKWLTGGAFLAVFAYMMLLVFSGMRLAATVGRDLRPAGSFATPIGRGSWLWRSRPFMIWYIVWFGGIAALLLYSLFR